MLLRRVVAAGCVAVLAGAAVLGVIPGTSLSAAAITDDTLSAWDRFWQTYGMSIEERDAGLNALFTFGMDQKTADWYTGNGECTTSDNKPGLWYTIGGQQICEAPAMMFAPSPGGSAPVFTATKVAAGVKASTGKPSTVALNGDSVMAGLGGIGAITGEVDEEVTDLTWSEGAPPGYAGGTNVTPNGTTITVTTTLGYNEWGSNLEVEFHRPANLQGGTNLACFMVTAPNGNYCGNGTVVVNNATTTVWRYAPVIAYQTNKGLDRVVACTGPGVTECITWYPVGHVDRPPDDLGGLVGTMESTYACRAPSGATNNYYSSVQLDGGGAFEIPAFTCAADELLLSALVEWVTNEGTQVVFEYDLPEWVQEIPAEWQNCGTMNCTLQLWRVTGDDLEYCGELAVGCTNWYTQPNKEERYQCKFGPFNVELAYCNGMADVGKSKPNVAVVTETGGKPQVKSPAESEPIIKTWPDPAPNPDPQPDPNPNPDPDPIPPGRGDPSNSTSRCFPTGWAIFNPMEWVYRPITCALTWAFVPRQAVVTTKLNGARSALAGHGVLAVVPAAVEVPGQVAGGFSGGCEGHLFALDVATSEGDLEAALPCSPAEIAPAFASPYEGFRTLLGVVILAAAAWGSFITIRAYFGGRDA